MVKLTVPQGGEITDELEHAPARLFIKRYIRYKYAPQSKEGAHKIAPLPERVINKGIPPINRDLQPELLC